MSLWNEVHGIIHWFWTIDVCYSLILNTAKDKMPWNHCVTNLPEIDIYTTIIPGRVVYTTRGGFRGGHTRRAPLFFAAIGCLTLRECPRQKECSKLCEFTLKITISLRFWGSTSPSDTPCPHRCQCSVSP